MRGQGHDQTRASGHRHAPAQGATQTPVGLVGQTGTHEMSDENLGGEAGPVGEDHGDVREIGRVDARREGNFAQPHDLRSQDDQEELVGNGLDHGRKTDAHQGRQLVTHAQAHVPSRGDGNQCSLRERTTRRAIETATQDRIVAKATP